MKTHLFYLIALVVLFSCSEDANSMQTPEQTLKENRELWESQKITNYQIVQTASCFCTEDFTRAKTLVVRNNALATVDGRKVEETFATEYLTIEEAFDFISKYLDKNPAHFSIEYHDTLGYPTSFFFDLEGNMADEEIGYSFAEFRRLE